jgi:FMN-dependent NADH-azoreductase
MNTNYKKFISDIHIAIKTFNYRSKGMDASLTEEEGSNRLS